MLKKFKFINYLNNNIQPRGKIIPMNNMIVKNKSCQFVSIKCASLIPTRRSFLNFSRKCFSYSLPDDETSHSSNIRNRPNRFIELNLKKSDYSFVMKMNIPFNDEIQILIFNKLMKNQNIDIISEKIKFEVILKVLLITNYSKGNAIYFIVDEDEEARRIIKLLNELELDLVLVKDETQLDLFNTQITNRFLLNYKNFKKIPKIRDNSLLVFLTENKKGLVNWINCEEFKNVLQKSNMFILNKNAEESGTVQAILKKFNLKNLSIIKNPNEKQSEVLFNFGIKHFAMCVQKINISLICRENCKKFLRLGKRILIICDKELSRQELLPELAEIEGYIRHENSFSSNSYQEADKMQKVFTNFSQDLLNKAGHIRIVLNSDLLKNKDEFEKYDVVIEYPFISTDYFIDRRKYLKKLKWGDVIMITLYLDKDSQFVEELRKMNLGVIRVRNLLSSAWLFDNDDRRMSSGMNSAQLQSNSNSNAHSHLTANTSKPNLNVFKSSEQAQNIKKDIPQTSQSPQIPSLEFYNKIENYLNAEKKLPSYIDDTQNTDSVHLEELYAKIQKNKYLQKQIFNSFMRQNFKKFFNLDYESISLITGEPGWYTIRIISKTPKQMEERYSVIKFLIQQGVCTMDYEDKVFRVNDKFDHVLDIVCEKFKELKKNAEIANLEVEILNELPIFHRNQFSDLIRHKNKFEEKIKEDLDETQ